jgi:hypothetical protein
MNIMRTLAFALCVSGCVGHHHPPGISQLHNSPSYQRLNPSERMISDDTYIRYSDYAQSALAQIQRDQQLRDIGDRLDTIQREQWRLELDQLSAEAAQPN